METPVSPTSAPEETLPNAQPVIHQTVEDYQSPGERKLARERRIAWRAGAVLILLNMLMNIATVALGLGGSSGSAAIVVSSVVDVVIAINLFRDRKWARDLAIFRLALGLIVYGVINGVSGGATAVAATVFTVGAILLVLAGEPRYWKTVTGSIIFVIVFLILVAGIAITGIVTRASGVSADSLNQLNEAQAALKKADYPTAIQLYGEVTRAEPKSAVAFYGLCSAYQESGNGILAIKACDTAAELAPKDSNILAYRAFVLLNLKRFDQALAASDQALAVNNKDYFAYFIRGAAKYAQGQSGYEEDFAKGMDLAPNDKERAAFRDAITRITGQ